jgi:hypothetical protein
MDDVFEVVATHCTPAAAETVASLSHTIRDVSMPVVARLRQRYAKFVPMIGVLKQHFSPATRPSLEQLGLRRAMERLLCESNLDVNTLLLMQDVATMPDCEMRPMPLTRYTTTHGTVISITVGSLIDAMTNDPLCVFFNGHGYRLRIYSKTVCGQVHLPVCSQGRFFSWGFAMRVGDVGSFQDAPVLHANT